MNHYVEIVAREGEKVEQRLGPMAESAAERTKRGAEINLNHDDYFVRIVGGEKR